MLCSNCKKREAKVKLTQIVNNEKVTRALCNECASQVGFHSPLDDTPFPLADLISGMLEDPMKKSAGEKSEPMADLKCETCGLTFDEFARQGRFGCGDCYTSFRPRLEQVMRKIHGASLHRGRVPEKARVGGDTQLPIKEEERLEEELQKAIGAEDFERAAELRDKLKTVREKVSADQEH